MTITDQSSLIKAYFKNINFKGFYDKIYALIIIANAS